MLLFNLANRIEMLKWVKPIRDNSVQVIKDQPAQDRAALPMEEPRVTTPRRGILGAIKRLFKKKKNVPPLYTNQEGSLEEHGGSSAEVPHPAVKPKTTTPKRRVQWADRQQNRAEPLNSNQERSAPERAGKDSGKYYNRGI